MTIVEAVQSVLRQYAGFNGRARRSELWWFILAYVLLYIVVSVIDSAMNSALLGVLVSLGFFLPSLAVEVRRLHDINKSGWWLLLGLLPIVGIIILIVWWCQEGTARPNRFGADPKASTLDPAVFDASPPPQAPASRSPEAFARLEQLGRLRDQGVLTAAEFEAEKAKIIGPAA